MLAIYLELMLLQSFESCVVFHKLVLKPKLVLLFVNSL
jgi:hypothetical protein